ncbi:MAG: response regulator, partial [Anaerolineales bacterium]|nr:response regulator [Anaerolineales bacterium]
HFVQNHRPDLILLDINMPGMDGYSVIEQMRQIRHLQNVPIVALTANVMKGDKEKSLEAGFNGYIQKPINVDEFPAQVMSFIASS